MTDNESKSVLAATFIAGLCLGGLSVWYRAVISVDKAFVKAMRP